MVVSHHGRPIKLDLDCSETLRCPLLSFPRLVAHGSEKLVGHQDLTPCIAEDRRNGYDDDDDYDGDDNDGDDEAMERTPKYCIGQPAAEGDRSHQQDGGQITKLTENDLPTRSAAMGIDGVDGDDVVDVGRKTPDDGGDDGEMLTEDRRESPNSETCGQNGNRPRTGVNLAGGRVETNTNNVSRHEIADNVDQTHHHHHHGRSQPQPHQQHEGVLVPVQLVAVLVDGSGKGWMAARRLWTVSEVGFQALSKAGLSAGDVDADQEVSRNITVDAGLKGLWG